MGQFTTPNGLPLMVHDRGTCEGIYCPVHRPSPESKALGKLWWRADRAIFERICKHGIGHYDMDQYTYHSAQGEEWQNVHACDGCCVIYDEDYMEAIND